MTNSLALEYGPKNSIRVAPDGAWSQPAGRYGRGGVLPRFARNLIAAGYDPVTPISVTSNGTPVWKRPGTLSHWAGLTVQEPDDCGLRIRRHVPRPAGSFASRSANLAA
ncbi:hypothetical protein ACEN2J_14515 [Pseudorhodobacter sp. W20_MBD10_FR17]|uniref:hypothetical protein n=1 Tax=Pseudorhodobacter sp. W20_MBD10_FR17 TaxID=3240266 RepID=UPI003F9D7934